jgi:lipopolysaccharide export system permease protein
MKKIDSYIFWGVLKTFFFCLLLFTLVVVVVDISEKTDNFVKANLSFTTVFVDYYLGFIPRIDAMLFPLFTFISVIFFTSRMAGRTEIVAILSSGVSFKRFLVPYFFAALVLAGGLWFAYKAFIPNANKKWANFQAKHLDKNFGNSNKRKQYAYFKLDSNSYVGYRYYDTTTKGGNTFFINKFKGKTLVYNFRANSFAWDAAKKNWRFAMAQERFFDSLNERVVKIDTAYKKLDFKPIDLEKNSYLQDQLSTPELIQFITKEKARGSETVNAMLVEQYNRDAIPFSVIVLTLIGAIIAAKKVRGGSGLHLAVGLLLSVAYILVSRLSFVFATKADFSGLVAAWIPNVIFVGVAIYLYYKAPK